MIPRAYYNEHDRFAAQWLRNLIAAGQIMDGEVDERDIREVQPTDVVGFARCHFFAGIGGWDYALRLSGWPEDWPVWTGSCPCQPFSAAGRQQGQADPRHLWPEWFRLIRECRPPTILGEQVSSAIAHGWLDLVFDDLEAVAYACGAAIVPACSVGAPHRRERLWFVADASSAGAGRNSSAGTSQEARGGGARGANGMRCSDDVVSCGDADGLAESGGQRRDRQSVCLQRGQSRQTSTEARRSGDAGRLADAECSGRAEGRAITGDGSPTGGSGECVGDAAEPGLEGWPSRAGDDDEERATVGREELGGHEPDARSPWADLVWLLCRDGTARPAQRSIQPLVARLPEGVGRSRDPGAPFDPDACTEGRVGRLRGYGNSIVPHVAAEFIRAYLDACCCGRGIGR